MIIQNKSISDVIKDVLKRNREDWSVENVLVFPSDIQRQSWYMWAVNNPDESGVTAVNVNNFIAWDRFKSSYILPEGDDSLKDKSNIPPLMRKVFAQSVLKENNSLLKGIISANDEKSRFVFTDWLSKTLPSLRMWDKKYHDNFLKEEVPDDDENKAFEYVFQKYEQFLEENKFYEPSYLDVNFKETCSTGTRKNFYIFYPEILEDYSEYDELLANAENVFVLKVPEIPSPECIVYDDARKELRMLCLKLRRLQKENVDLSRVAVTVPDLDTVRPYLEREFRLYSIPYVVRDGLSCNINCGGDIFEKIKDCLDSNYSYNSVRSLLMDGFIPWKNPEMNLKLVRLGGKLKCVVSTGRERENDIWLNSLEKDSEEYSYYSTLRDAVENFNSCTSFKSLSSAWVNFRDMFIEESKYFEDENYYWTNKILGSMLSDLAEFSEIEEKFMEGKYRLENYLDFYINEMASKIYNPNEKKYGVNVFTYRVAACADYDHMFIINAGQNEISVSLKQLPFMSNVAKREKFGLKDEDSDGSTKFIALYEMQHRAGCGGNFRKNVTWSSSLTTFSGASITHTGLNEIESKDLDESSLDEFDFVKNFSRKFLDGEKIDSMSRIQKTGFENWKNSARTDSVKNEMSQSLKKKIEKSLRKDSKGNISLSASGMKLFFECPKKFLYQNVMGISEEKFTPTVFEANELGTLYHKIIELSFDKIKVMPSVTNSDAKPTLPILTKDDKPRIEKVFDEVYDLAMNDEEIQKTSFFKSVLAKDILLKQKHIIKRAVVNFLIQLCGSSIESKNGFGGWTIEGTEMERTVYEPNSNFKYTGKIDCVLTENGKKDRAVIIDYKSGTMPKTSDCYINSDNKIKNFQMPMYVKLLENQSYQKKENEIYKVIDAVFYSLKENENGYETNFIIDREGEEAKRKDRKAFESEMNLFTEYAKEFARLAMDFDFSCSKNQADKNYVNAFGTCKLCQFKTICRTSFNIGSEEI